MTIEKEVFEFQVRNFAQAGDWKQVDEICSKNIHHLSIKETSYWIRAKYLTEEFESCIKICENELIKQSDNLIALRFLCRSKTKLGYEPDILISDWKELLRQEPENLEAMNNIARALHRMGNREEAMEIITQVLALNSHYAPSIQTLKNLERVSPP